MFYDAVANDHGLPQDPFKALVAPRPIGWISSLSADGIPNLAPFSYFNAMAQAPHYVAFGGGLQVALGADVRLLAPGTRMSVMEIKWGLVPDMSGTQTLRHLVRLDVAKELTFTGRVVSGSATTLNRRHSRQAGLSPTRGALIRRHGALVNRASSNSSTCAAT